MPGRAALLAAPAVRARRLLPLAPAAEDRLRQHGSRRAELDNPGLQARSVGAQRLDLLAQPFVCLAQRLDGLVPVAQSSEERGHQRTPVELGLQPLLDCGLPQGDFQIADAPPQHSDEVHLVVVSRQLPALQLGFEGQPADCRLEVLQLLLLAAQPAGLPVQPTGLPAQGTDFPAQRLDRVLPLARAFQRLAQLGARSPGRRSLCRSFRPAEKRRDLPAQRRELVLLLLRPFQGLAQPGVLPVQGTDFPAQRLDRVLPGCWSRCSHERSEVASGRRHDRILPGLRRLQGFVQPEDLHAQRHDRAALARIDTGLRKQLLQPRHLRLEEQRVLRRAADLLHLLDRRLELVPALVELPLQRTGPGTGVHLRPAKLFAARFRRVRPSLRLFAQSLPVPRCRRRRCHGRRPDLVAALAQRQRRPEILVAHRHVRDDSESSAALPVSCRGCRK